jgi:putative DNA primase/helicase
MSLRAIVAALGGDLYAGGRRANVPAPGHSPADRSVSLLLKDGRVLVHCFGGADWRDVLDDLRARGLVDGAGVPAGARQVAAPSAEPPSAHVRRAAAAELWAQGRPVSAGTPAALHIQGRCVRRAPFDIAALRSHPDAPVSVYKSGQARKPALLAAVSDAAGALTAVEITYLDPNGRRAGRLRVPRKTIGVVPPGSAVRLDPAAAEILVAEGVFTALSAGERFGLPAWALLSTSNLRRWSPPMGVRRVLIAADRGRPGEAAAAELWAQLRARGVAATVRLPPAPHGDWNDAARTWGMEEGRSGSRGAQGRALTAVRETIR